MSKTVMTLVAIAIAAALTVAAGSFWAGSYYQRTRIFAGRQFGMMGRPGQGQRFGQSGAGVRSGTAPRGERLLKGRLDRVDDDQLTLTTQQGSVKVTIGDGAQAKSVQKAKLSDLKVGKDLIIESAVSADGRLTAKLIIQE